MNNYIGKTVGHYRIVEQLGQGGMGIVFKAEDIRLKRDVALKFLPAELTRDSEAKNRFIQEAQAASALDHPNICNIHEIEQTEDGQLFIIMSCYEGENLKLRLDKGQITLEETIDITTQILLGLSRAHEAGIIHRDVKPANIIITSRGEVKIVDFGLAKLSGQSRSTKSGRYMGTIAYMSPEQTRGEQVDHRTDIWSVGVVLYEMITGRLPFTGEYDQAIIYAILNEEPESLGNIISDLPEELEKVLKRALAKNPDKRYNYVEEFMIDLIALQKKLETGKLEHRSIRIGAPLKYRIAVLPFSNFSPDPEDEYFADGMTEELISTLSKITEFKVIARTSMMQYKKTTKSAGEIGQELKVGNILESSIRKAGNQLRISVQLIDVQSEENLWSQVYDRELEDVFLIQSDIAQSVATALKIQLAGKEENQIRKKATENLEAYGLYLKGRFHWDKRNEEGLKKSIEFFEKAIELDPNYALSYSGMADSYIILGNYGMLSPDIAFNNAMEAAEKALKIDHTLAQAHTSLGCVKSIYGWDWEKAEQEFTSAIELNPKYATTYHWHAINYLTPMGKFEEAISDIKKARELDPLSLIIHTTVGLVYYFARDYDKAIEQYQKTLEMDPNFEKAYFFLGWAFEQKRLGKEAVDAVQKAVELSENSIAMISELGSTYASLNMHDLAEDILQKLEEDFKVNQPSPYAMYSIAATYSAFADAEKALYWLNKAYKERSYRLIYLNVDPKFDNLRENSQFQKMIARIGLKP